MELAVNLKTRAQLSCVAISSLGFQVDVSLQRNGYLHMSQGEEGSQKVNDASFPGPCTGYVSLAPQTQAPLPEHYEAPNSFPK